MINRLSQNLINQIAAGEVVVRPASVVKELVENAIDAQATRIRVTVANDNLDLTVTDDGRGIALTEAALALERHTTSKIRRPSDLEAISTRGFRGEALASIASVAKLQLRTRTADTVVGARVVVWGGDLHDQGQIGCPQGTAIEVRDLFYNTPARRKFLKSKTSEWGHILRTVTRQALTGPAIGFRLENEGRISFDMPPAQSLKDRFVQLCAPQLADRLLEVDYERSGVRIRGFVSHPSAARKDRRHQYFFVNGRPVALRALSFSLQQAYHGLLMTQRFPIALLFAELDAREVDVNVHPTKEEVRFRDERKVLGLLNRAVVAALEQADLKPQLDLSGNFRHRPDAERQPDRDGFETRKTDYQDLFRQAAKELQFDHKRLPAVADFSKRLPAVTPLPRRERPPGAVENVPNAPLDPAAPNAPSPVPVPADARVVEVGHGRPPTDFAGLQDWPQPIGQLAETYIVALAPEELILIDQHAAHERLLYLKLLAHQPGQTHIQQLLLPLRVEIEPLELPAMEELAATLRPMGFEIEPFGGATWIVNALPVELEDVNIERLLRDLLDDLQASGAGPGRPREIKAIRERVAARMACHSAIRAGQRLQPEEMERLIYELYSTPTTYTCPHGRPTIIRLSKDDLDKQFGRRG